jgi:hypothetical protein
MSNKEVYLMLAVALIAFWSFIAQLVWINT